MKVWKLDCDVSDYESFRFLNDDKEFYYLFSSEMANGEKKNGKFDTLEIKSTDIDKKNSDFSYLWEDPGTVLLSGNAKKCLESYIEDYVEFIPLKYKDNNYYMLNITHIVDAIDYDNAELHRLSTGLIVRFDKYSFKEEKIKSINIFKVYLNGRVFANEIFISSELKKIIEEANLTGLKFIEVWDSEKN